MRAHGRDDPLPGYRWPVAFTRPIAAPAQRVWEVISTSGNLKACHPFCAKNPVNKWPGEDSRDEIHYLNGRVFERRFRRWIPGIGYDLVVGRPGGGESFVSWRVRPHDGEHCALRITVYPHPLQQLPVAIRWLPHLVRLRPMLTSYLASVTGGFEWFVRRGEPVPRNLFGEHPWFSGGSARPE